ncbi:Os08g0469600 [Oryza sativa Japonica Group]|uniref:Os08g0469600 protein n=3 Tax=Oryza sativa TaxID=4530 RepID=A0A0P0XGS8_ORYSJ|nr:hypothetical protein OsI_29548 [Oryza sativa Indica Group]KAB8108829.1 hypothetical protein EE612_044825 [Oryza sativa]BAD09572.1 unknown protein [Oryza sativa Japonica Group]BAF23927.1 Os08g0469600 [Oryza sativa Japonica Group]BAG88397.1 unnamed protein product [Oryza sativa Japonica Group]|eukprot:NP_001062013.1 Os08g0469600 [Oryza sativa Japonica Group]
MPPASSAPIASAAVSSAGEPSMVKERLRVLGHLVPGCRKLPAPMLLGPTMWPRWRCSQGHVLIDLLAATAGDACDRGRRVNGQRAAHDVGDRAVPPQRRRWGGATMRLRWRSIPSSIRIMRS